MERAIEVEDVAEGRPRGRTRVAVDAAAVLLRRLLAGTLVALSLLAVVVATVVWMDPVRGVAACQPAFLGGVGAVWTPIGLSAVAFVAVAGLRWVMHERATVFLVAHCWLLGVLALLVFPLAVLYVVTSSSERQVALREACGHGVAVSLVISLAIYLPTLTAVLAQVAAREPGALGGRRLASCVGASCGLWGAALVALRPF